MTISLRNGDGNFFSYRDIGGSRVGLVASGPRRSIYYLDPKPGIGASPGRLFSYGTKEGKATLTEKQR